MDKKIIIGLFSENEQIQENALEVFSKLGFIRVSILSKIEELVKHLMGNKIVKDEEIALIRKRGYKIQEKYWINHLLSSLPENKNLIVIEDLNGSDIVDEVIIPFVINSTANNLFLNNFPKNTTKINIEGKNLEEEITKKVKQIELT